MLCWLQYFLLFAGLIFLWLKYVYSFWRRNGFPEIKPNIPFGCLLPFVKKEKFIPLAIADTYFETSDPFVGVYVLYLPQLMIRDLELLGKIMTQDFEFFEDRDFFINEESELTSVHILSMKGDKWRRLRQQLSPMFTVGKLKSQFPLLFKEIKTLDLHFDSACARNEPIDLLESITNCVLNVIGTTLFGLNVDTFKNSDDSLKRIYDIISHPEGAKETLRQFGQAFLPTVLKLLKCKSVPAEIRNYFIELVKTTIEYRDRANIRQNDLIQALIDIRKNQENEFSVEEIAGNLQNFFHASVETTASVAVFCIYELSRRPDLLNEANSEIQRVLETHNSEFSYEALNEMKFIDLCMKEALRLYTSLPMINRMTVKDYKIPGHNLTIKKGTTIILPFGAIHRDEKYFPKPLEFIPSRFEPNSGMADENAFLPFGAGPRMCIAARHGWLLSKAIVCNIVHKYRLQLLTTGEIQCNPNVLTTLPKEVISIKLQCK